MSDKIGRVSQVSFRHTSTKDALVVRLRQLHGTSNRAIKQALKSYDPELRRIIEEDER